MALFLLYLLCFDPRFWWCCHEKMSPPGQRHPGAPGGTRRRLWFEGGLCTPPLCSRVDADPRAEHNRHSEGPCVSGTGVVPWSSLESSKEPREFKKRTSTFSPWPRSLDPQSRCCWTPGSCHLEKRRSGSGCTAWLGKCWSPATPGCPTLWNHTNVNQTAIFRAGLWSSSFVCQ